MVKKVLKNLLVTNMLKSRPLWIFLSKISAYRRDSDKTKYMSFLIKNYELLEKYNEIW